MIVVSLFDESGNALRPWAAQGHSCYAFDITNEYRCEFIGSNGGFIFYIPADLTDWRAIAGIVAIKPDFIMGFPPCTDLATSGARHFAAKRAIDPLFQIKAAALARMVEIVGILTGKPWMAENPRSVLSTLWRKADYVFNPHQYGGYLPIDDVHPRWSQYIAPRDAYPKETWLWTGNGFIMPACAPVPCPDDYSQQFYKLGGKSKKTKQIRSETPRGFALAVCLANS